MADPSYIVNGVLTDGEAWVALQSDEISPAAVVEWTSTNDGQVGDWSQYMDLVIIGYGRTDVASTSSSAIMHFNNDTATNYEQQYLYGDGSSTGAAAASTSYIYVGWQTGASSGANQYSSSVNHIYDINSGKYKSVLGQSADDHDGSGYAVLFAHTWESQAPITEIDITGWGGVNFVAGSRFDLFGILPRMVA